MKTGKKTHGISYDNWLWLEAFSKPSETKSKKNSKSSGEDTEAEVSKIIVDNPNMNASTFVNTLKSKGLKIVDEKPQTGGKNSDSEETTETDAASSNTQMVRPGVASMNSLKKKNKKESAQEKHTQRMLEMNFRATKFIETTARSGEQKGYVFKTILLQEGLGNFRDTFWYSREALESAIPVFEGKKIYADHPSVFDEETRPERSVKDILGHFENVQVEEQEDGRSILCADVVVLPEQQFDWARGLMKHALEYAKKYPDKEFVGLSINAAGDSDEMPIQDFMNENELPQSTIPKLMKAMDEGIETVNVVKVIENAVSIDLVTEPGAGGKILKLLEEAKMATKSTKKKEAAKKHVEAEDEVKANEREDGDGGDEGHDDADQDKKLMKAMVKKHLGDKSDGSEEEENMFKQAAEAFGEMGYESEDAHEAAGHAMKLAKHMAAKKEASKDDEDKEEAAEKKEALPKEEAAGDDEKEAARESEIITLKSKVALLESEVKKRNLNDHVESLCNKSGLSRDVTKVFKTHLKESGVNSVEKADKLWKMFIETYRTAGGEAGGYVISTEKQMVEADGAVSFADCKLD